MCNSLSISPWRPSYWYANTAHYMGVYVLDIAIDPQPASGSCLPSSLPHPFPCRWLVTDGAVNYSGWAGIRYEKRVRLRGRVEEDAHSVAQTNTHTFPHRWLPPLYARRLHILQLLLLFHLQIVLSINLLFLFLLFMFADTQVGIHNSPF